MRQPLVLFYENIILSTQKNHQYCRSISVMRYFVTFIKLTFLTTACVFIFSNLACQKKAEEKTTDSNSSSSNTFLYVSSGSCYAGGVTTSAGSNTIVRYILSTGYFERIVADYNSASPGDAPVSMVDNLSNPTAYQLLVAVENTAGRRIDYISKYGGSPSTYLTNANLSGALRQLTALSDGSIMVSKSTAIERFSSGKSRTTSGANPYISAPGSTCATSTTLIPSVTTLSNGKIIFSHAAATPNNKIGIIASTGYSTTADCLSVQAAPTTTAMPTAVLVHSSGKIITAWGSTTSASNFIYSYDLDATTNTWSNPVASYTDFSIVNGISAIVEDKGTGDVYVANGASTHNNIERFKFDSTTKVLTRVGVVPYIGTSLFTKCVSSMWISN